MTAALQEHRRKRLAQWVEAKGGHAKVEQDRKLTVSQASYMSQVINGYSFAERKVNLNEARSLIQKALKLAPNDPFISDSLGWVEFRMGNMAEARRILEEAYKSRPDAEIGAAREERRELDRRFTSPDHENPHRGESTLARSCTTKRGGRRMRGGCGG